MVSWYFEACCGCLSWSPLSNCSGSLWLELHDGYCHWLLITEFPCRLQGKSHDPYHNQHNLSSWPWHIQCCTLHPCSQPTQLLILKPHHIIFYSFSSLLYSSPCDYLMHCWCPGSEKTTKYVTLSIKPHIPPRSNQPTNPPSIYQLWISFWLSDLLDCTVDRLVIESRSTLSDSLSPIGQQYYNSTTTVVCHRQI